MSKVTLGLRSSSGRKRLSIATSASGSTLRSEIAKEMKLTEDFKLKRDANGRPGDVVRFTASSTVRSLKLANGDVLYVVPESGTRFQADVIPDSEPMAVEAPSTSASSNGGSEAVAVSATPSVDLSALKEDDVDVALAKETGRIKQGKTPNCNHSSDAQKCIYCTDKEPYDEAYLKEQGIKHMSFQSYIRKLSRGMSKGKFAALENISCEIKPNCSNCLKPWPEGVCSKCIPPAITLNMQPYRHVDNVMFENKSIVDNFLAFWRATGSQRVGILYGVYEPFPDVPLGVKSRVVAIYEPPQESSRDGVKFNVDPSAMSDEEKKADEIAAQLGLRRVGWIFTDLMPDGKGNVRHFRHADNHFLSAQECITAGFLQSQNPNVCKHSSSGYFGSKFATVLVTGNKEKDVHMEGYQVSNQCMALSRARCLVPTKDAPELGYVRESNSVKYVPDVFYKMKDKYRNEVTKAARPLPVEYLLVDVPVSTPREPQSTFYVAADNGKAPFPIENRPMEGQLQDIAALASYRHQFSPEVGPEVVSFFSDFHLLLFLATQTISPLSMQVLAPLLRSLKEKKTDDILAWSNSTEWQTIQLILNYSV